ncbi:transglycosylase domain-containing protein [Janthinobacterium sp. 17J80-10]|uniref:penicillin-binding protein 1A n=1 Tax=Janthinobacterium sp. 17J80-10 TaxID=2497863 RepID=UPI001F513316|nr:transglycosylase domain-containing protein [Janthinobacterium sp. 17J80-10]
MLNKNNSDIAAVSGKRFWRRLLRGFATAIGVCISVALLSGLTYLAWLLPSVPELDIVEKVRHARPSIILAADGSVLGEFRQKQQEQIALKQVAPHVLRALIATEDQRFFEHSGVDLRRTALAVAHTLSGRDQGGSTITQQLARNLFPEEIGRTRSVHRKAREMLTALKIERAYDKQEILEIYLNTVPFLYNAYGIEMGARTYFGKPAAQLSVAESATLVGMLKGTQYYNPVKNPERALKRRNVVLGQLLRQGLLTQPEFDAVIGQPLGAALHRIPAVGGTAPHFTAHVRKWLAEWAEREGHDLQSDGMVIHTTLEPEMQAVAERAVEHQALALQRIADVEWGSSRLRASLHADFYARMHDEITPFSHLWKSRPELVESFIRESGDYRKYAAGGAGPVGALAQMKADRKFMRQLLERKSRLEAGFLAMDPASGEIKAWVGSRDFNIDQFDHVAQAVRQPGSTFKPFVYAAALEQGISPRHSYRAGPVEITMADGRKWRPTDMDVANRPMSLREGLVYSKNTITAQVMQDVGIDPVVDLAQAMGVRQSRLDPVISIALGTSPVTLLEMVSSYATIARAGEYRPPVSVKRIVDRYGGLVAEFGTQVGERVLSEEVSTELIDMLRGAVDQGTGKVVKRQFGIDADIAGKTGTTQNNTDGWFILMHPELVAGAWIGFNDQRVTMRSSYWGQGGHNAILVVGDFFRNTLREKRIDLAAQFPRPLRPTLLARRAPQERDGASSDTYEVSAASPDAEGPDGLPRAGPPPGQGIIVRRQGGRTLVGDARGMQAMENEVATPAVAHEASDPLTPNRNEISAGPESGAAAAGSGN